MSAASAGLALAHVVSFGLIGLVVGDCLLTMLSGRRAGKEPGAMMLGLPERVLFAFAGFVVFACALMVLNLVGGGLVFGTSVAVPIAAAAVLGVGRRFLFRPVRVGWAKMAVTVVALAFVFILPVLRGGSGARTGDVPWHLGWTEQLLAGEPVPTGPAPEFAENAYPWGFHALLAAMVRLVPGADPLSALDGLQMLLVFAIPAGAACLANLVNRRAGWPAALAAGLIGGFGWLLLARPDFITSPSQARYGADLVVASPNSVYELLPPALPREVGLALLAASGVAAAWALRAPARNRRLVAGALLGLTGLVSVPMIVVGGAWVVAGTILAGRGRRLRAGLEMALVAAAVFALWAGPVAANYFRLGGFANVTPRLGVEWPLPAALASWGLLLPAAAGGALLLGRRGGSRVLLSFCAATGGLLALALLREAFDWSLGGNPSLLHQGRMWPAAHLLAGALAGIFLTRAFDYLRPRIGGASLVVVASVVMVGAISPVLASVRLTEMLEDNEASFVYERADLRPGSWLRRAAEHLSPDDVVRVEGPDRLGFQLWQFSGVRLARYDDPRLEGNDLRIRYADAARAWRRKLEEGGFIPDFLVVREPDAYRRRLESGVYAGEAWVLQRFSRLDAAPPSFLRPAAGRTAPVLARSRPEMLGWRERLVPAG